MPLSKIQIDVLRLLAVHRDPESYVAGATPLNRNTARYSNDIDVFHDREERVAAAALHDVNVLAVAGYRVVWLRQLPLIYTVEVTQVDASTRLEWVVDGDYRFFPTMRDETFGYVLHPADLAMNKVMAATGGREVRDLVDLVMIHETILPLGAVIWAAVEKSPGFTPEGLIAEIRRNAHYPAADWRAVLTEEPLDPQDISARLRAHTHEAKHSQPRPMRWFHGVGSRSHAVFVRWFVFVETPLLRNVVRRHRPVGAIAAGCTRTARGRAATEPRRPGHAGRLGPRAGPALSSAPPSPASVDCAPPGARGAACGPRAHRTWGLLGGS